MEIDAAFRDSIEIKCCDKLEMRGLKRHGKRLVSHPFDADFHMWIGLNIGFYSDHVDINPFVGIHSTKIMRMKYSPPLIMHNSKYSIGIATYGIHMGEICPRERGFRFDLNTDIEFETDRLADLYVQQGIPWANNYANYDTLLPLLLSRVARFGGYPESVLCCLLLMGRNEEAIEFARNFNQPPEELLKSFKERAEKLLRHLGVV